MTPSPPEAFAGRRRGICQRLEGRAAIDRATRLGVLGVAMLLLASSPAVAAPPSNDTFANPQPIPAVLLGVPLAAGAARSAQKAKRCSSGQVRRTVAYVHRKGGRVHRATGCVPRSVTVPVSFAALLRQTRQFAAKFVPASVARVLRGKEARRVLAADRTTDAALAAMVAGHAASAATRHRGAYAAAVGRASDGETVVGPRGTETLRSNHYTNLDTSDDVGESFDHSMETKSTRVAGPRSASSTKNVKVKHLMNRCPDAGGIARGTINYSLRDTRVAERPGGGHAVSDELGKFDAKVVAHFGDDAHITSVEVIGDWSFTTHTSVSRRSVSGAVSASGFHQNGTHNYLDLKTTVTTGTDDAIATGGRVLGAYVADVLATDFIEQMLNTLQRHVLGGGCVEIVPDAPTVHVAPGRSVAIVAHLTDHHGTTFPGLMKAYNGSDRVSPTQTQGNPNATFTYTAPATASPGDTDDVQVRHVSKRGVGHGGHVVVIFDKKPFPQRFEGTWTRTFTSSAIPGWTETVTGTAAFVRNPAFPQSAEGQSSIPYDVVSSSVTWSVSGSAPAGSCGTVTYSGSGTAPAMENSALGHTDLSLEDVSNNPDAPKPEPKPYYYSIRASGDPTTAPQYHLAYSGPCSGSDAPIAVNYLNVGWPSPFGSDTPPAEVEKSDTTARLEGHRTRPEDSGPATDDTWSFTGSG